MRGEIFVIYKEAITIAITIAVSIAITAAIAARRELYLYIHLGNDVSVRSVEMLGVFDMETATVSKDTRAFLAKCEDDDIVTNVSPDLPKSFVLCVCDGDPHLYVTSVGTPTLRKRAAVDNAEWKLKEEI